MKKAIVIQVMILVIAYFTMTPDTLEDNTHLFGLFGDVEITKGNTVWVMSIAAVLSVINLWFWWPKTQVTSTPSEKPAENTKNEAKEIDQDPKTPTLD